MIQTCKHATDFICYDIDISTELQIEIFLGKKVMYNV